MKRFRFHSLALPHTVSNTDYVACAYTQKIVKFSRMMNDYHEIIHYGHPASDLPCAEHVTITDDAVLQQAYGSHDWRRHQFRHNRQDYANQEFIRRAIPEIESRVEPGDFVLCWWGQGHDEIARAAEQLGAIAVEPGIGYTSGHFARWRAYESHAVRTAVEGCNNGQNWYSRVIPNYFDPAEFTYQSEKQDYVLYLGRVTELKGITTCIQACAADGVKLKIAGQGRLADLGYTQVPDHVEELGYADVDQRRELMAGASALIIATTYLEPFGGVQVEALLSGTPVIAPAFGAFAEVQLQGVTGFLCWTMRDYVEAIHSRWDISPAVCRQRGLKYSLAQVRADFQRWFEDLTEVYTGSGWTATGPRPWESAERTL